jgi:hypothetical protein
VKFWSAPSWADKWWRCWRRLPPWRHHLACPCWLAATLPLTPSCKSFGDVLALLM